MRSCLALTLLICLSSGGTFAQCDEAGLIETTTPAPPYSSLALRRHLALVKSTAEISSVDAVAIGDSIVQLWPEASLQRAFSAKTVLNLGVGSDRIQNTLWRLKAGDFSHVHAAQVLLLLGTNNLGSDSACAMLDGYRLVVREITQTFKPQHVVIVEILRRETKSSTLEEQRRLANEALRTLADRSLHVDVVALDAGGDGFYSSDGLHPAEKGYESLSNQLLAKLASIYW